MLASCKRWHTRVGRQRNRLRSNAFLHWASGWAYAIVSSICLGFGLLIIRRSGAILRRQLALFSAFCLFFNDCISQNDQIQETLKAAMSSDMLCSQRPVARQRKSVQSTDSYRVYHSSLCNSSEACSPPFKLRDGLPSRRTAATKCLLMKL